ncbi:MAG: hypothetical protein ACRDZ3_20480 [Acidimicrobiia bacterium]
MLLSGGATGDGAGSRQATGILLDVAATTATSRGRDLLIEADDSVPEIVDPLIAQAAIVVDEVHIVAEG